MLENRCGKCQWYRSFVKNTRVHLLHFFIKSFNSLAITEALLRWTNKHVSSSKVWLMWLKIGASSLSFLWLFCASVSSTDNNYSSLSGAMHVNIALICNAVFSCVSVRSYLQTEWWCYRGCRSWHRGQSRCLEDRGHMWRSPGLGWMSPTYTGNTLTCRRLLVDRRKRN